MPERFNIRGAANCALSGTSPLIAKVGRLREENHSPHLLLDAQGGAVPELGGTLPMRIGQFALEHANEGIHWLDASGRIIWANSRYCEMMGYSREELTGMPLQALCPDPALRDWPEVWREIKKSRTHSGEYLNRHRDGHLFPVESTVHYMECDGEEVACSFVRDITRRKRLDEAMVEAADREQRRLAQELHDGLCQDLKSLEIMAVLAREKPDPETLDLIAAGLNKAVRDAYTVARGLLPVGLAQEGLQAVMRRMLAGMAASSGVEVTLDWDPALDGAVWPQAAHVFRIAQEAAHNAVRHGHPTRVRVRLMKEGAAAALQIEDDGGGFFPRAAGAEGGLGLEIMKCRAATLGAMLDVRSQRGAGVTVICQPIPLQEK